MRWTPLPAPFDPGEAAHCPSRPCHQSRSARRWRAPKCRTPLGSKARIVGPPLDGEWRPVEPLEARFHAAVLEREPDREVLFLADEIRRLAQLAGVRRFAYPNRLVRARDYPRRNFDEAAPRRLCDQGVGECVRLESRVPQAREIEAAAEGLDVIALVQGRAERDRIEALTQLYLGVGMHGFRQEGLHGSV